MRMETIKSCVKNVGVEPVMFLYMLAVMMTSVIEEAFFIDKACRINYGKPANICDHISDKENHDLKLRIQVSVSTFYQWYGVVTMGLPILLSFFLGAWSDRVGRKIPLILGLASNLIYSLMVILNSLNDWRLEVILWTGCLPRALGGGNLTVFMASFAYLADTTSPEQRTLRTTLLEVAYLVPLPVGVALGGYLFNGVLNKSYWALYTIQAVLLVLAILYSWIMLKTRTAEPGGRQHSACWCGLLNWSYIVDSLETLFRPRAEHRRGFLALSIIAMAFYTFQRDESHMMYLYTQMEFDWDSSHFTQFRTIQSALCVVGLLIGVPILLKVFKLRDTVTLLIGSICHIAARIFYIFDRDPDLLYIGAVMATLGPVVAPIIRSITSKLVPSSERGKAFAALCIADSSAPILSTVVYSQIYNHTIETFPQSIFVITICSQIAVFIIGLYMTMVLKGRKITQAEENSSSE